GTVHTANDFDYWNFESNIEDGLSILNSSQSAGYSHYTNLVTVAGGPPSLTSSNDGDSLSYCQFAATASGSVHSWEDAEWITTYNGTGGVKCGDGTLQYPRGYYR